MQLADFGPALEEKISTALLRNPKANGMAVSYDDLVTVGGSAAVMSSGRRLARGGIRCRLPGEHRPDSQEQGSGCRMDL